MHKKEIEKSQNLPLTAERKRKHQQWMAVMREGQSTPLPESQTKSLNSLKQPR